MNYRHVFHAGGFTDLLKHPCLLAILARMTAAGGALGVIDTHAGAGLYDLASVEAQKSGEANAGVVRLMADPDAPSVFNALKAAVEKLNPSDGLRRYPGSPLLIQNVLRDGDSLIACELRPDDFAELAQTLNRKGAEALRADGYATAANRTPSDRKALVLIDPPFERGDEYAQVLACIAAVRRLNPSAVILVWLPLKDLETFDGFLRGLEAMGPPPTLVVEARLRRLDDPMRLNGCVLAAINPPAGFDADAAMAAAWVVRALGEAKGEARVWRL